MKTSCLNSEKVFSLVVKPDSCIFKDWNRMKFRRSVARYESKPVNTYTMWWSLTSNVGLIINWVYVFDRTVTPCCAMHETRWYVWLKTFSLILNFWSRSLRWCSIYRACYLFLRVSFVHMSHWTSHGGISNAEAFNESKIYIQLKALRDGTRFSNTCCIAKENFLQILSVISQLIEKQDMEDP